MIKLYIFTKNGAKCLTNIWDSYFSFWNNSCQSTHAGLLHTPLQWIKSALKLCMQRTIYKHFQQKSPCCKMGFTFPETITKTVSIRIHSTVPSCEQLGVGTQCRRGSVPSIRQVCHQVPGTQLKAQPPPHPTQPLRTSSPACNWEIPKQNERSNCFLRQ